MWCLTDLVSLALNKGNCKKQIHEEQKNVRFSEVLFPPETLVQGQLPLFKRCYMLAGIEDPCEAFSEVTRLTGDLKGVTSTWFKAAQRMWTMLNIPVCLLPSEKLYLI